MRKNQLKEKLRDSEKRFSILSELIQEGVVVHRQGIILELNRAFCNIFGYKPHELIHCDNVIDKIFEAKSAIRIGKNIDIENTGIIFARGLKKDGTKIRLELVAKSIVNSRKKIRIAVIRDITEKKRMEDILIQNDKIISAAGLVAGMAHEINDPMAGIVQTCNVLASRLGGEVHTPANIEAAEMVGTSMEIIRNFMEARDIPRMIDSINNSVFRLETIIDEMLSYSRKRSRSKFLEDYFNG